MKSLLRLAVFAVLLTHALAGEPFLKQHDVIAFVGGEDMVAASEYGYIELLLTHALPDYQLRFRNLAWEGDTVFEQRRDLNFPPLEAQLDKIGATMIICQFGQMECLAGKEKLPAFIDAYEKLVDRMGVDGKRRVILISPSLVAQPEPFISRAPGGQPFFSATSNFFAMFEIGWPYPQTSPSRLARRWNDSISVYSRAIDTFAESALQSVDGADRHRPWLSFFDESMSPAADAVVQRDGIHLNDFGAASQAWDFVPRLTKQLDPGDPFHFKDDPLLPIIRAKNHLWFDYWRPQNWAFLNGDRINQPSSRDWRDPSKRWFPDEIEQFIPLIEAKEHEIDALAAKLK